MKASILNVAYTPSTMHKATGYVLARLDRLRGGYLCFSNVHTTVMAAEDETYRNVLNESARTFADGAPVAFLLRHRGFPHTERIAGPAFMEEMFRLTADGSASHYFYGATNEVLDALCARLRSTYPDLKIAGAYAPPFGGISEAQDAADVARIREAAPDLLWVGLGAPKQELWMHAHKGQLPCVMAGVGAAFDFYAKTKRRAPVWMQRLYLEWFYRLCQEPKRLFKRYFVTNFKFVFYLLSRRS